MPPIIDTHGLPVGPEKGPIGLIDVILPSGGRISGDFARAAGTETKALIRFKGQTILAHTLEILRATGRIGRCVVIGPDVVQAEALRCGAEMVLPEGDSAYENIMRGLQMLAGPESEPQRRVLIAATDLPFLTVEAVATFLNACPPEATISMSVVTQADFEARYPNMNCVFVPLREGAVTLGCLFLIEPHTLFRNRVHLERSLAARKSNLAMARLAGLPFILAYLFRRLTIADIEKRCRQVLDCVGSAVCNMPAELAFDIDTPEEYAYARAQVGEESDASPRT